MINVLSKIWDRDANKWVSDNHAILGNGKITINIEGKRWQEFDAGKRFLISNYSNIDDSSGVNVYDGHIIRFNYGPSPKIITAPVVFVNGGFFVLTPSENPSMCLIADLISNEIRFDVVGNVFENGNMLNTWNT